MAKSNEFVILLRGINVGGHNKVPMAELKEALAAAGFDDVVTYIQSGNVLADVGDRNEAAVVADVESVMQDHFGLNIPTVARPAADWAAILDAKSVPGRSGRAEVSTRFAV